MNPPEQEYRHLTAAATIPRTIANACSRKVNTTPRDRLCGAGLRILNSAIEIASKCLSKNCCHTSAFSRIVPTQRHEPHFHTQCPPECVHHTRLVLSHWVYLRLSFASFQRKLPPTLGLRIYDAFSLEDTLKQKINK